MLIRFKSKKGNDKVVELTPKIARKIAEGVKKKPTSYIDCLKDIESRSQRGYTWTYMLQVEEETIVKLQDEGWNVKTVNKNESSQNYMVRIEW